jgi:hypothetical protein
VTWLIGRTSQLNFCSLYSDSDVCINLLAELTERSFNLNNVAWEKLNAHSGRKVYRQFTNS